MPKEALSASSDAVQSPSKITECLGGCGALVPYRTNSKTYCEHCRLEKKRASYRAAAEVQRRKKGVPKIKGTSFICVECGCESIATSGNVQKYCSGCAKAVDLRNSRKSSSARSSDEARRNNFNKWFREQAKRPEILLSRRMKRLVALSLSTCGGKGGRSWKSLVGYSVEELRRHVELQFQPGMSWENRSEWHLDHIVPLSSFEYSTADDLEFKAAWAITNLRPLWGRDNVQKSAKRIFLI